MLEKGDPMKTDLIRALTQDFQAAAHRVDDVECWFARELQELLGYSEWRNFIQVVDKARTACKNAGQDTSDHFVDVNKMVFVPTILPVSARSSSLWW